LNNYISNKLVPEIHPTSTTNHLNLILETINSSKDNNFNTENIDTPHHKHVPLIIDGFKKRMMDLNCDDSLNLINDKINVYQFLEKNQNNEEKDYKSEHYDSSFSENEITDKFNDNLIDNHINFNDIELKKNKNKSEYQIES